MYKLNSALSHSLSFNMWVHFVYIIIQQRLLFWTKLEFETLETVIYSVLSCSN